MIETAAHPNGVVTLRSTLLAQAGIPHGFSTRQGGTSPSPYDSLNLSTSTGDDEQNVLTNRRALLDALALRERHWRAVKQVHGSSVAGACNQQPEADAMVSDRLDQVQAIQVADCLGVLIACEDGGVVAAVHAGWRGIVAGVIPATIRHMADRHAKRPSNLIAAIGPSIGIDRFEVGEEVAKAFDDAGMGSTIRHTYGPKPHIDLVAAAHVQLRQAGLDADAIDRSEHCTYRDDELFFSHRRDRGRTGRMAAVIACRQTLTPDR